MPQLLWDASALVKRYYLEIGAAILATYLDYSAGSSSIPGPCVLVASDQRLLRAAASEGMLTLNPETLSVAEIPAFVAGLR